MKTAGARAREKKKINGVSFRGLGIVCCRYLHTRRCAIEIEMFKSGTEQGAGNINISPHYSIRHRCRRVVPSPTSYCCQIAHSRECVIFRVPASFLFFFVVLRRGRQLSVGGGGAWTFFCSSFSSGRSGLDIF